VDDCFGTPQWLFLLEQSPFRLKQSMLGLGLGFKARQSYSARRQERKIAGYRISRDSV